MFNRKITSESFDDSLDGFEEFLQDPLTTKDLSNKLKANDTSTVDLETGEVLSTSARNHHVNPKQQVERTDSRSALQSSRAQNEVFKSILSFLLPIGASFLISSIMCFITYQLYSSAFSSLSLEILSTTAKVSALDESINRLQALISSNNEIEEVFSQLDTLSDDLENIENTLQSHLQSTNKPSFSPIAKKVSPSDVLKSVSYLGFFGTSDQPVALVTVKDEKRELKTGQLLIDLWQIITIHPHQITLSHPTGVIQNISRKKSLF